MLARQYVARHLAYTSRSYVEQNAARRGLRVSSHLLRQIAEESSHDRTGAEDPNNTPATTTYGGQRSSARGRLPALALFAVGLPLGWYLSNNGDILGGSQPEKLQFVKYTLVAKENVSSTCSIFALRPATNKTIRATVPDAEWAITSVEFKQPQLQIARSYTCLPAQPGQAEDELRFLIKREPRGEVSNFLHRLSMGATVEMRGPYGEYPIPENIKSAVFLAGGTGIAPALQTADVLDGEANLHILWANRRREDCIGGFNDSAPTQSPWRWWSLGKSASKSDTTTSPAHPTEKGAIVRQLESLKRSFAAAPSGATQLTVDYFVDEEGTSIDAARVRSIIAENSSPSSTGDTPRKVIFVSGPAGFIEHWAGPKQWYNGHEIQGPLGGVLSSLDLAGWEVVKL